MYAPCEGVRGHQDLILTGEDLEPPMTFSNGSVIVGKLQIYGGLSTLTTSDARQTRGSPCGLGFA